MASLRDFGFELVQSTRPLGLMWELVCGDCWIPQGYRLLSLHIHSMWETTVMHKQVSGWTVNFGPNFPEYPFLELKTRIPPPPHFGKLQIWDDQSLLQNTPHFGKLQIWDDQSLLRNTPPHFGKLQIWDDQSLLRNTPPISENFRFGMTKVYSRIPPPPPILENFRFGMTKVYSGISPHFGKLQIWDDQSLLWNTPPGPPMKIVRESKSEIFRIPRVTTCWDFIQPG